MTVCAGCHEWIRPKNMMYSYIEESTGDIYCGVQCNIDEDEALRERDEQNAIGEG